MYAALLLRRYFVPFIHQSIHALCISGFILVAASSCTGANPYLKCNNKISQGTRGLQKVLVWPQQGWQGQVSEEISKKHSTEPSSLITLTHYTGLGLGLSSIWSQINGSSPHTAGANVMQIVLHKLWLVKLWLRMILGASFLALAEWYNVTELFNGLKYQLDKSLQCFYTPWTFNVIRVILDEEGQRVKLTEWHKCRTIRTHTVCSVWKYLKAFKC